MATLFGGMDPFVAIPGSQLHLLHFQCLFVLSQKADCTILLQCHVAWHMNFKTDSQRKHSLDKNGHGLINELPKWVL